MNEQRMQHLRFVTRRHFLRESALGAVAFASMAGAAEPRPATDNPLSPRKPHFAAKAKSVIYLHMSGAPPQQELYDYKPKLKENHMKPCPKEILEGQRFAFIKGHPNLLGPSYKFAQHGQSGAWVSELLPNIAGHAD